MRTKKKTKRRQQFYKTSRVSALANKEEDKVTWERNIRIDGMEVKVSGTSSGVVLMDAANLKRQVNKSPALASARWNSSAVKACIEGAAKEIVNETSISAEMYGIMLDSPRMRVRHRTGEEYNASDVPMINAGYF